MVLQKIYMELYLAEQLHVQRIKKTAEIKVAEFLV